jgi:hypothetical protein
MRCALSAANHKETTVAQKFHGALHCFLTDMRISRERRHSGPRQTGAGVDSVDKRDRRCEI